jgi:hypothetical protein
MIKCTTDSALREELTDVLFDLNELYSIASELSFYGEDLTYYKHWLKETIVYVTMTMEALQTRREPLTPTEIPYVNKQDLNNLTVRVYDNLKTTIQAYQSETSDGIATLLNISGLTLKMTKECL